MPDADYLAILDITPPATPNANAQLSIPFRVRKELARYGLAIASTRPSSQLALRELEAGFYGGSNDVLFSVDDSARVEGFNSIRGNLTDPPTPTPTERKPGDRNRIDRRSTVENDVQRLVDVVERMGAHPHLTRAVVKLGEAREALADYLEHVPETKPADAVLPTTVEAFRKAIGVAFDIGWGSRIMSTIKRSGMPNDGAPTLKTHFREDAIETVLWKRPWSEIDEHDDGSAQAIVDGVKEALADPSFGTTPTKERIVSSVRQLKHESRLLHEMVKELGFNLDEKVSLIAPLERIRQLKHKAGRHDVVPPFVSFDDDESATLTSLLRSHLQSPLTSREAEATEALIRKVKATQAEPSGGEDPVNPFMELQADVQNARKALLLLLPVKQRELLHDADIDEVAVCVMNHYAPEDGDFVRDSFIRPLTSALQTVRIGDKLPSWAFLMEHVRGLVKIAALQPLVTATKQSTLRAAADLVDNAHRAFVSGQIRVNVRDETPTSWTHPTAKHLGAVSSTLRVMAVDLDVREERKAKREAEDNG